MKQQHSHASNQHHLQQLFWGRVLLRKWLNLPSQKSDYTGDTDSDAGSDVSEDEPTERLKKEGSRFKDDGTVPTDASAEVLLQLRRRKSETFRAQYINKKEIKICTGTWNVAGKMPPDDLDLDEWLHISEPADIYVLGFQEFIKLNAGNIFGAEDSRPVPKWESIIRDTLNKIQPENKFKCYSDPPSPTKFRPYDDAPYFEDDVIFGSDSDCEEEIYPLNEEFTSFDDEIDDQVIKEDEVLKIDDLSNNIFILKLQKQFPSSKRLDRLLSLRSEDDMENTDHPSLLKMPELVKSLSGREKLGFCWPEPPMHLLSQKVLDRPDSSLTFNPLNSFKNYNSIRYRMNGENRHYSDIALLADVDLESIIKRKRRSPYVRIVSKQMVGVFLTIWVRRNLRKHIHNVNVSTVGVGAMGYIGNKGSISVSMSVYQTLMCFICSHLASGDKEADLIKRNADVQEIHRRTHFKSITGLPTCIYDHERIIWLGDLNYRINLTYEQTRELISIEDWSQLTERDQLIKELRKGRAFDGWTEGILNFAPTYKYEVNEDKYVGDGAKARRTPSWCDRVLCFGHGMKLIKYRRSELQFSDHRPVSASYMVEVEEFSPKKLQRALTFTDAEIEKEPLIVDSVIDSGISQLIYGKQAKSHIQR